MEIIVSNIVVTNLSLCHEIYTFSGIFLFLLLFSGESVFENFSNQPIC